MKFSCERCGKKYATAETPAAGRVYKIKCKACGHLIVVKASAGAGTTAATEMRPPTLAGMPAADGSRPPELHPQATPDIHLEVGLPEPTAPSEGAHAGGHSSDSTQEISVSGISTAAEGLTPPPADAGYVDLFADGPKQEEEKPSEDPFLAAARASLPDGYGANAPAPDPFASLREEFSATAAVPPQPPPRTTPRATPAAAPAGAPALPKVPVIPKPAHQKNLLPLILIGAGALVLVGILAFVLLGGSSPAPAPQPVQAQAPAPVAPPPAAPASPPLAIPEPPPAAPPPVVAAPPPAEKPQKADRRDRRTAEEEAQAREERREREREREAREREAREERDRSAREAREAREREREARDARAREEREARERDRLARDQRAREEREEKERERQRREAAKVAAANMAEEESGLTQGAIEKVLGSTRRAFENCIISSGSSGEVKLDGRRVMLRLNIQNTGTVTYPTLDDVTLNGTELGQCLKSAARVMVFPKFKGDTMHIEVPLVLAGR